MSIMNANNTQAMANVTASANGATTPVTFTNNAGFATAGQSLHNSIGVYIMQIDEPVLAAECVPVATPTSGTVPACAAAVTQSGTAVPTPGNPAQTYFPSLLTVSTYASGALADTVSFSCAVFRFPQTNAV
jgi:hypothetical protein